MTFLVFVLVAAFCLGGCSEPLNKSGEKSGEWSLSDAWTQAPLDVLNWQENPGEKNNPEVLATYDDFFLVEGSHYAYNALSEAEQLWYRDVERILGSMAEKGILSEEGIQEGLTEQSIDHVFQCVMMDHPELFYVDGYVYSSHTMGERLIKLEFSGTYNVDREQAITMKAEIEAAADVLLLGISDQADDYEKIKYVYEMLIRNTDYDLEAPNNQNIYSVLVGKVSVCQGYAKATQYLLNRLGVEATLVSGTVQGGNRHGWNLVCSNGNYYYVDTTWGDASYQPAEDEKSPVLPEINYDYLCVTTEEIVKTHVLENEVPMPICTAIDDNYFVREGAYFTEMDEEQLRRLFQSAKPDLAYQVTLKCASQSCYEELMHYLIEESKVFRYYDSQVGGVVYVQNEMHHSLTFWVTN